MTHRTDFEKVSEDAPRSIVAKGFLALGAAALFASTFAAAPAAVIVDDCTLTFEPAAVVAGAEAAEVRMIASEEIMVPDAILFQDGSGLTGELHEDRPFYAEVDPSEASAGEWLVTVQTDQIATCTGTLVVTEGS